MEVVRSNRSESLRKLSILFIILFFAVGIATFFASTIALLHQLDVLPQVCPLKRWTGFLCSFCGMTHAWIYFWHGEWSQAFEQNRLSIPLFIGTPLVAMSVFKTVFWSEKRIQTAIWMSMVILVFYTIVRNLHS